VASDYDQKSLFLSAQTDSFNSFLASTVHVAHAHLWRPERWVDSEAAKRDMAEKVPNNMLEYFKLIDDRWFQGPWVHGKTLTSSDCYLFVVSGWLKGDGVDLGQFEKVSSHYQNMLAIAEVKALVEGLYR
jgi:glutathione S-transferase